MAAVICSRTAVASANSLSIRAISAAISCRDMSRTPAKSAIGIPRQWRKAPHSLEAPWCSSASGTRAGNSPNLKSELLNAIIDALDAHTSMSTQALNSETVRDGIKEILLTHSQLWEPCGAGYHSAMTPGAHVAAG